MALNDIRQKFYERAEAAKARLSAWAQKHLTKAELRQLGSFQFDEPYYFSRQNHAFPGSSYVVRQDEPLSIIAYSLSSRDFQREMTISQKEQKHSDVLHWRSSVVVGQGDSTSSTPSQEEVKSSASSVASTTGTDHFDPDEDEDFAVAEPLRINMKRKKRTKDAGILSIRMRSGTHAGIDESVDTSLESVENSNEAGTSETGDNSKTPTASRITSQGPPSAFNTVSSNNDIFQAHVSTISPQGILGNMFRQRDGSTDLATTSSEGGHRESGAESTLSSSVGSTGSTAQGETPRSSTRGQKDGGAPHPLSGGRKQPYTSQPNATQGAFGPRLPTSQQPASPHIKHTLRAGEFKISCVSWFAEGFAKLRTRWGIDEDFVASLSRCKTWNNAGGKSKSGFYLTDDGKWIAKQLLNVWTVDEKEAFLEFAPAYLRYMMNSVTNDCPTLLVKIAGVYSLKIKDMKTNEVKLKLSVQVLENVFAGGEGRSVRFDLKGIRDRRAGSNKAQAGHASGGAVRQGEGAPASVWWDGEWIEAVQPRAFVPEEDKALFQRALRNDLAFLTASNVMDYSLLVGLTEPLGDHQEEGKHRGGGADHAVHPFFRVRIVDFLGAWTLVKQLESSSKKALKSQAPTVIPPHDYATRFSEAVESYFIGCPQAKADDGGVE